LLPHAKTHPDVGGKASNPVSGRSDAVTNQRRVVGKLRSPMGLGDTLLDHADELRSQVGMTLVWRTLLNGGDQVLKMVARVNFRLMVRTMPASNFLEMRVPGIRVPPWR